MNPDPRPDCPSYRDCGGLDGGSCHHPDQPFGDRPSYGTCNRCPHNARRGQTITPVQVRVPTPQEQREAKERRDRTTRAMWHELHARAAGLQSIDLLAELDWLVRWAARVPCGECKRHWFELWDARPADLESPAALFVWGVGVHNAVNARLGKPIVTVEAARAMYSAAAPSLAA